ncbi:MAG: hypothetical protein IJZ86_00405 [Bacteroides sp.]|nr:hypothetical protein [Bacteroides sp.]
MEKNRNNIKEEYGERLLQIAIELRTVSRHINCISTLRVLLVVAGIAAVIYLEGAEAKGLAVITTLALFAKLVVVHNRLFRKRKYKTITARLCLEEVSALRNDFTAFDDGNEWRDTAHRYSQDLDVVGPHSLFQCINRTCSEPGKKRLAALLSEHLLDCKEIEKQQHAVQELAKAVEFRLQFRVERVLHKGSRADEEALKKWSQSDTQFRCNKLLRALPVLVTATNLVCFLLVMSGVMPASTWGIIWTCFVLAAFGFTRRITKMQNVYGEKLQILGTYARQLRLMDGQEFQSERLKELQQQIEGQGQKASEAIQRLNRLMNALDQRNNMFMHTLLCGTFFWELWQVMRIEAWKEQYANKLQEWLEAIGEMDMLCSLGTFAYNHPDYIYPTLLESNSGEKGFCYTAEGLGHPLMEAERCVRNDIDMQGRPAFHIVTGANMAGKSTYLRTVGVNFLLACIGAPVCAHSMCVTPVRLISSLRTSDSLNDNESYFFAELKRLQHIIQRLQAGDQLFIILDEILKGTNSMDKQRGSMALVKQFMTLKANGIIATHDLLLGSLIEAFPENIRNYCFEADIKEDELTFSYRMRAGVAQNMNACFLMQKMGIAITD